jgi:hypothetical protein
MELQEALTEIASIRRQIAGGERFHGYRAIPVASGAALAIVGALVQGAMVPQPSRDLRTYLIVWISVAIVAGGVPAVDVWRRHGKNARAERRNPGVKRHGWSLDGSLTRLACEQFAPCVLAGGLVTAAIGFYSPQIGWVLPGLWAVIFSLGLFSSFRLLPPAIVIVASWYLLMGCLCLALGPVRAGLAPWTMLLTFGIGQAATAAILARQPRECGDGE